VKIVVTGGAGFIGSHLCALLLKHPEDEVICVDNLYTPASVIHNYLISKNLPHFRFEQRDVCEPFDIPCDQIYHLACPASPIHYQRDAVKTIKTAVLGTMHSLELAAKYGARLVITSTSEIYGDPLISPQDESYWGNVNPVGPRACYDEGKRVGEALAYSWAHQYGVDVRIARIFNTYGPGMASGDGRIIPNFITQALRNESVTVYGDGSQTRSFCYVSDTIGGLHRLMDGYYSGKCLVVNIGNPDERTVESVAKTAIEVCGSSSPVVYNDLPQDDPKRRCPDITLARKMLRWEPKIDFIDGMMETASWFRNQVNK
jgi:UDP-glucuronate decarboxylase